MLLPTRQTPAPAPRSRRAQNHEADTAATSSRHAERQDDQGSRASDARADDGDRSQEKPFEKIVRRARESVETKGDGEVQGKGEQEGKAGHKSKGKADEQAAAEGAGQWLSLQDVVKSKGEGERPVIKLKQSAQGKADASAKPVGEKVLAGDVLVARKGGDNASAGATAQSGENALAAGNTGTGARQTNADSNALARHLAKAEGPKGGEAQARQNSSEVLGQDASRNPNVEADGSGQQAMGAANARIQRELGQAEARQRENEDAAHHVALTDENSSTPKATFQAVKAAGNVEINEQAVSGRAEARQDGPSQPLNLQDVEIQHSEHHSQATRTVGQAAGVSHAGQTASAARGQEIAGGVVGQITNYLRAQRARAGDEMVLRLDPPELGTVKMTLQASRGELRMMVETSNPRTLVELQREASVLMQRLSDNGVDVRRMEFVQSDTSNNGNGAQAGLAEQESQHQGFGQSARDGDPSASRPGEATVEAQEPDESPQVGENAQRVEDDAINLWM
jgi:hypothetical protein